MKSEELRLNNYVMCRGALSKVISINENTIGYKKRTGIGEDNIPLKFVNPIPLTEEWLLKFGFKKSFTLDRQDSCYRIDIFRIDLFGEYFNLWHDNHPIISIEYVHQLQNLYFALTNEELSLQKL